MCNKAKRKISAGNTQDGRGTRVPTSNSPPPPRPSRRRILALRPFRLYLAFPSPACPTPFSFTPPALSLAHRCVFRTGVRYDRVSRTDCATKTTLESAPDTRAHTRRGPVTQLPTQSSPCEVGDDKSPRRNNTFIRNCFLPPQAHNVPRPGFIFTAAVCVTEPSENDPTSFCIIFFSTRIFPPKRSFLAFLANFE